MIPVSATGCSSSQSIVHARRANRYVGIFLLDLDRFKVINDSLGHSQGDTILLKVAERLASCIRPGDTLSRLGGDEFAIVMCDVNATADIRLMAKKILTVFDTPFSLGGRELRVTTSIGASLFPRDGGTRGRPDPPCRCRYVSSQKPGRKQLSILLDGNGYPCSPRSGT